MDPIDYSDPRKLAEEAEEEPQELDTRAASETIVRLVGWMLDGCQSPAEVGYRVYIMCYVLYPHMISGLNLQDIASKMGNHGRSDANRLTNQFSEIFNVRGINQRNETIRKQQSIRWHKQHGTK